MNNKIAIIGKPNVGKSTLFNRIIGRRKAIVDDHPGITRDRIYNDFKWNNHELSLIDTGGIADIDKPFQNNIIIQAKVAIEEADLIIFVIDGRENITNEDFFVLKYLRNSNKTILVAANKLESNKEMDYSAYELGLDVFPISALHGEGVGNLLDECLKNLDFKVMNDNEHFQKIAIIGKPNAGKSSLLNVLANEKRAIVSPIAGTTRDSIGSVININEENFYIIDTAGIKKKSTLIESVEHYALIRAMNSLDEAHLAILIMDVTKPISHFSLRIAGYALEKQKPIILVLNKWDLISKKEFSFNEILKKIKDQFIFMPWAPIIFISSLKKQNIDALKKKIIKVFSNLKTVIKISVFNDFLNDIQLFKPASSFNNGILNIKFGKQVKNARTPTFLLFVNHIKYLHFSYQRYIQNQIRKHFDFEGLPIKLIFKNSRGDKDAKRK